jgi:hypothetical protein
LMRLAHSCNPKRYSLMLLVMVRFGYDGPVYAQQVSKSV